MRSSTRAGAVSYTHLDVYKRQPIYYSQSEPLVRNIDRHVQLKYPFYMFDEKSFEIDEEGQP